ncbi:MAG: metalloregulator ArsR/SmtB family transcription factor [Acidobacteriota bacterium]
MNKNKRQKMSPEALQLVAARFKVLSDPMRLRILQLLEDGETGVSALAEAVESTQPNVSKHLKILQDAGMLARRQEGNTVFYSIADESVFQLCEVVCSSLQERFAAHASIFSRATAPAAKSRR